jgi:hypothetical protein
MVSNKATEQKDIPILFPYDTSVLITSSKTAKLHNDFNIAFEHLNKRFAANLIPLNCKNLLINL